MKIRRLWPVLFTTLVVLTAWWFGSETEESAGPPGAPLELHLSRKAEKLPSSDPTGVADHSRTNLGLSASKVNQARENRLAQLNVTVTWPTGELAQDVTVLLNRQGASVPVVNTTNELGTTRFDDLEPGQWRLTCVHGGRITIQVHPGQNAAELLVPQGRSIEVEVVDTAGAGIAGAQVVVSAHAANSWGSVVGYTDPGGRLNLRDIGDARSISARKSGYEPSPCVPVRTLPGAGASTATLRLSEGGTLIEGRVRDITDGSLIEGAVVQVRGGSRLMAQDLNSPDSILLRIYDLAAPIETSTNSAGDFNLESLPSGTLELTVIADRYAATRMFIDQPNAGDYTWVDVELSPSWNLTGLVVREDGSPGADVLVWAGTPRGSGSRHTYCDEDGRFAFYDLESGIRALEAWGAGGFHGTAFIDDHQPDASLRLVISRNAVPTGTLRSPEIGPLQGWTISREPPALASGSAPPRSSIARTDEQGRFWLRPGDSAEGELWIWSPVGSAPFPVASSNLGPDGRIGDVTIAQARSWSMVHFEVGDHVHAIDDAPRIVRLVQIGTGYAVTRAIEGAAGTRFDGLISGSYAVRYVLAWNDVRDGGEIYLAEGAEERVIVPTRESIEGLPRVD